MAKAILILGSNSANKALNLERAVLLIQQKIGCINQQSSIYYSAAWGYESPNNYLNQVVVVSTETSAENLLSITQSIEKDLGRTTKSIDGIYHDRPIDIDILFYNSDIINTSKLTVPHPHIAKRRFVLTPLHEVMPNYTHPTIHKRISTLLAECQDNLMVKKQDKH